MGTYQCDSNGGATPLYQTFSSDYSGDLWYALQVRCRFESKLAAHLQRLGLHTYFPVSRQKHRWSDRVKVVDVPMLPGYLLTRCELTSEIAATALHLDGVIDFVRVGKAPAVIPEEQVDNVRRVCDNTACVAYPPLAAGDKVRVLGGCLDGLEGSLVEQCGTWIVISVGPLQRNIAFPAEAHSYERIGQSK
jgi:transcription antitermination factor NusG